MAVGFSAAPDALSRTASLPASNLYTASFWFFWDADNGVHDTLFNHGLTTFTVGYDFLSIDAGFAGPPANSLYLESPGSSARGNVVVTTLTWHHLAIVRNGSLVNVHLDGAAASPTQTIARTDTPTLMRFGLDLTGAEPLRGRMAAIKVWEAALSFAEIMNERWCYQPVRRANLGGFWPCVNQVVASSAIDYSGLARDFTIGGTLDLVDGPPIAWSAQRRKPTYYTAPVTVSVYPMGAAAQ
jgi:hypothetical protein